VARKVSVVAVRPSRSREACQTRLAGRHTVLRPYRSARRRFRDGHETGDKIDQLRRRYAAETAEADADELLIANQVGDLGPANPKYLRCFVECQEELIHVLSFERLLDHVGPWLTAL
jgi:hypothetical protein